MTKKSVDDYLQQGIHGIRLPKEEERKRFLGTLRERIVIALTIGQVMTDSGLKRLEEEIQKHPDARLIMNGHVAYRYLKQEKDLAMKYNIPHTTITDEENKTDIGAVLTYDYAIDKEEIFIKEEPKEEKEKEEDQSFFSKLKKWFT